MKIPLRMKSILKVFEKFFMCFVFDFKILILKNFQKHFVYLYLNTFPSQCFANVFKYLFKVFDLCL